MKTDLQNFLDMLEGAGYTRNKATSEHDQLGPKEFMMEQMGAFVAVTFGCGRSGDKGCYSIFYFKPDGNFTDHNANMD